MKNGAHLLLFCDVTSLYVRILHVNYVPYNFYYTLMLATTVKHCLKFKVNYNHPMMYTIGLTYIHIRTYRNYMSFI